MFSYLGPIVTVCVCGGGNVEGWRACTDLLPFACESMLVQEPEQQVSLSEGSDTAQVIVNMNPS